MIGFNNKLPLILSVASLMLSMAAFGNAYPRELGIGYLGIIVGVLSMLTTILIGWQILIAIKYSNVEDKIRNSQIEVQKAVIDTKIDFYSMLVEQSERVKDNIGYYNYSILLVKQYLALSMHKESEILCNSIISDIKNGKLERINEYELLHLAVLLENLRKFDNPAVFALDNLLHQYIQERRKGE